MILFFSGIQILLFGIVGEYLGRIFKETKNRPLYLVNEYNGEKETTNVDVVDHKQAFEIVVDELMKHNANKKRNSTMRPL